MRNAIWFKNWISNKILNLDDLSVAELIQKFTDGKACRYCKALYGECPDEEDDATPFCNSRLMDWCMQKREREFYYCGVTGVYRYDQSKDLYRGVSIDGTRDRVIPFWGRTLDDLERDFLSMVDRYESELKMIDLEMKKLDETNTVRVLKDGEATGIIAKDREGTCYMIMIFRDYVESVECKDISVAFDQFLSFAAEKREEEQIYDAVR